MRLLLAVLHAAALRGRLPRRLQRDGAQRHGRHRQDRRRAGVAPVHAAERRGLGGAVTPKFACLADCVFSSNTTQEHRPYLSGGVHLLRGDLAVERVPRRPPQRRQFRLGLRRRSRGTRLPYHRVSRSRRGRRA